MNFGSVCSGIEAGSVALEKIGAKPLWFSEISDFPSKILKHHYPKVPNLGDMTNIANLIEDGAIEAPDMLLGGTPCQAFSLAGWKKGLVDERGQLTLKFIDIANAIDKKRSIEGKSKTIIFWENVEGVLKDKDNAFGIFISGLAGLDETIEVNKWSSAGLLYGKQRNIAWRIIDAKYFGLPQQRRRAFLIATDKEINPELILFEKTYNDKIISNIKDLYHGNKKDEANEESNLFGFQNHSSKIRFINNNKIEIFRDYTDCLYSAYGTKWNGNAAANNGSLYVSQNDKVRRLTPLECERLMGFPDNYTLIPDAKDTSRYQSIGNSWAVPAIQWIGNKIINFKQKKAECAWVKKLKVSKHNEFFKLYLINDGIIKLEEKLHINTSPSPNNPTKGELFKIVQTDVLEKFFISKQASFGMIRRKNERNINMNKKLENLLSANLNGLTFAKKIMAKEIC